MFLYLEWQGRRPGKINILSDEPDVFNYRSEFKVNGTKHSIYGNINPTFEDYYAPLKKYYKKSHYLSSHLQKSIRRMDDMNAVQTAKHFIDLDYISFIRRLPIIMLEDVTIHESFPVLIWLMIASTKGFPLKIPILKWLLGVVYYLSTCRETTFYSNKEINELDILEMNNIFLYTLRLRKVYGGMKGDMNMIEYYTHLLFKNQITINRGKINIVKYQMEKLPKKQWIIEANDFHCNSYILDHIKGHFPKYSKDYIKKLIWIFSSSINMRVDPIEKTKKESDDWEKIEPYVKYYQRNCIFY